MHDQQTHLNEQVVEQKFSWGQVGGMAGGGGKGAEIQFFDTGSLRSTALGPATLSGQFSSQRRKRRTWKRLRV